MLNKIVELQWRGQRASSDLTVCISGLLRQKLGASELELQAGMLGKEKASQGHKHLSWLER